jgi:hypothetical protein
MGQSHHPAPAPFFPDAIYFLKNLAKSAPPLRFNIHVPSSRNVLIFLTTFSPKDLKFLTKRKLKKIFLIIIPHHAKSWVCAKMCK